MKKETYIQLSLFNEAEIGIYHGSLLSDIMLDVLDFFISISPSIDPIWWGCRWSDMEVYTVHLNPNQKPKGCMLSGKKYPFDVWEFVKKSNKDVFVNNGINKAKSSFI